MSHYSEVAIELTDEGCLVAALSRLGFKGKVEMHQEAQPLYGYQGDVRTQRAHIIIRQQHVGRAANDLGFERQADGKYRVWVSAYDQKYNKYDDAWMGRLKQAYGVEKARAEAKKRGYRVTEQKLDNGHVRLVLRR
ncbi:MAG: DUF1257 domain-containing protein [Syntrophales bacterium]|nr:DUF1257 domain-containing protein [Syntrophales bacterium]MDD5642606.1 DUF1257 domain-containing protein [Syntrophales bacterium]